jgi:hypothetical protein
MSSNGKQIQKHPYMVELEEKSPNPIEWQQVDRAWILKYGGKVAKKQLQK